MLVAAVGISFSGILFRLSHVSASTGAFYRCVWALPPLFVLARLEDRRYGKRDRRAVSLAWVAGAFFAADLILWHNAIELVGAGLATVLGNTQVVLVGVLAWALLGEKPQRSSLVAIPIVGFGVVLISGRARAGRVRIEPAARRDLRRADRRRVRGLSAHPAAGEQGPAPPGRTAVHGDALLCDRLRGDRARHRRPRSDAFALRDRLARPARAVVAGRSAGC